MEGDEGFKVFADEVRALAAEREAVILAHNYQLPWIQDVADHVGDSLALSRVAAESDARVIVFCGVHFMAETAKILSPDKTVLLPALEAGCSLAESVTAEEVIAYRREHPRALVVSYVNTSAAVKAESDICCTSANAVEVVQSLPEGAEILFLPDFFLGEHVARKSGRHLELWMGECHVHAAIDPGSLVAKVARAPERHVVHPPRVRLHLDCPLPARAGRSPRRAHAGALHRVDGRRRPRARHRDGARRHRDRHHPPTRGGEPACSFRGGEPRRGVPLHEDDHPTAPAHVTSRARSPDRG